MPKDKQFDFRVIAGELKGKKIVSPDLGITRPPLTRLRKAIFDFLT
jgi:16S rRNA G966 N2-methylase RsmD